MSYLEWFENHGNKHLEIVQKLQSKHYTKEQIIDYFSFDNMCKNESDFCYLYAQNKKCHKITYLNCYMCACPHFRFNDNGLFEKDGVIVKSTCTIDSKKAIFSTCSGVSHLDCSNCTVPHSKRFIVQNFSDDWFEIMKKCKRD
ncbi:MAG: hypothetical protein PHN38_07110 [Sulfurospirillaceae bacterium]|nr:hypothetical protein [Sulfurospirillaceae bacterium]MDD3463648.1 hypothetical protein [Sulfurospirillaceae bacterium]